MVLKLDKSSPNQDSTTKKLPARRKGSPQKVVESWDEEASSNDPDSEFEGQNLDRKPSVSNASPPIPASLTGGFPASDSQDPIPLNSPGRTGKDEERRRPEKSTAVAGRLIAAGLGMRAPKKSEQQEAYDRAVRENEIRRRNREREAQRREQEENEKAKAAVWDSST